MTPAVIFLERPRWIAAILFGQLGEGRRYGGAEVVVVEQSKPKRKVSRRRYLISIVVLAVVSVVLASFALGHIGNYEVVSNSMAPTLREGDRVLVDQRPYFEPSVGDVIVLDDPAIPAAYVTKRVAGIGGQRIDIVDGYLCVDGRQWAPPGQASRRVPADATLHPMRLAEGQLLVLGDNQRHSEDSLYFGPVPAESVKGKLWFIYWPPGRMGKIN